MEKTKCQHGNQKKINHYFFWFFQRESAVFEQFAFVSQDSPQENCEKILRIQI